MSLGSGPRLGVRQQPAGRGTGGGCFAQFAGQPGVWTGWLPAFGTGQGGGRLGGGSGRLGEGVVAGLVALTEQWAVGE